MKFKKTTAALLVAGLTVAGSSYAWANETIFKQEDEQKEISIEVSTDDIQPDVTKDPTDLTEETDKDTVSTDESSTIEDSETTKDETEGATDVSEDKEDKEVAKSEFPEIPEGYTAGNLVALKQAYENAGSENAKQAILKNAHKAIAKFEEKQDSKNKDEKSEIQVELELIGIKKAGELIVEPVIQETSKVQEQPTKLENKTSTKEQQKAEKKALKEKHKAEKKALKAEHKAEKKNGKDKE